ncbi:MAG: alpha/beta hydrolase [Candidatus Phosphoribacter sp.]|nr:alpha/beta fold hydrolase [Actinomycetales bacterium]
MAIPPTRARRRLALLASGVVTSLSLSACLVLPFLPSDQSGSGSGAGGSGGSGATNAPVDPSQVRKPPPGSTGLDRFYAQTLSWRSCSGGECATLEVPIDYAQPQGASISLALLRVKARSSSSRIGSLVVNPGGPGGSGVEYATYANQIVGAPVRAAFDIVGFDPRGVGKSSPIDCLDDRQLDAFLGMDPTPDDPAEQQSFLAGAKALADGCAARGGALLGHVSTVEAARDMDVLRAAIGEPKLHFLGKSYGTFLGATYADLFPTTVGRFVLDGVVAPDLTSAEISAGQARGFELATRSYVENCIRRGSCPLGSTVDEGMQWIRDFLAGLDAQPVRVTGDQGITELNEAWGSVGMANAMYAQASWPTLTRALVAAKNGDGNQLMGLANQYADRTSSGSYTGNIMEVIYAVNCLDRPDTADVAEVTKNGEAFAKDAPTWGRFLAWGSVPCGVWSVQSGAQPKKISAVGSGPIVVVGTTRDPATIYEWSVRLRQQLSNAVLLTYDGDGHTAYTRSNSCIDRPIDDYFVTGKVPTDGLTC